MSVQFGKCNFDGRPVDPKELDQVRPVLAPYGPDGEGLICKNNVAMLYRAFRSSNGSGREGQPHVLRSGAILTWDGRLDNRRDLIERLRPAVSGDSTDLLIVAEAYRYWGRDSFARLIGDWALSIWDPAGQSVILARDFLGIRHLFYSVEKDQVTWCTILDPIVLFRSDCLRLEEEYLAGWLTYFPASHLTPYVGIRAVPPCTFVALGHGKQQTFKYWDLDSAAEIRYHTDAEYEEHFRAVFGQSIRRRLRSDHPVLAELSGGMDSSSIVCMADAMLAQGHREGHPLDTISYYDDSERSWDEKPYFRLVEDHRGRTGYHVDVGVRNPSFDWLRGPFRASPRSNANLSAGRQKFVEFVKSNNYRVILSGIGGDEVTGGVPTPIPEIQDLVCLGQLKTLAHQLKIWALNKRVPWFFLLCEALREFLPATIFQGYKQHALPAWLDLRFREHHRSALGGYSKRLKFVGSLPSFQTNLRTLDGLRRQFACTALPVNPPYEKRYPYLDRQMIEFLFGLPREQLVRPGQRRSLLRRALTGIVPTEILNRKRKALLASTPLTAVSAGWSEAMAETGGGVLAACLKIIDKDELAHAIKDTQGGKETHVIALLRALDLEHWLRHLQYRRLPVANLPESGGRAQHDQRSAFINRLPLNKHWFAS